MPESPSQLIRLQTRIIFIGLCIFTVLMPIPLAGNRIWALSLLQLGIYVLCMLQACVYLISPTRGVQWRDFLWFSPLLLLFVYIAAQRYLPNLIISPDLSALDIALAKTSMFVGWVWLLLCQLTSSTAINRFGWAIVISGAVQACYAVVLQLIDAPYSPIIGMDEQGKARGSFVYQNHFANYVVLCICVGLGLLLAELSSKQLKLTWRQLGRLLIETMLSKKLILRLCLVLMVLGLVMSHSRMGNAAFFAALFTVSLIAILGGYKRPPTFLKPLVISILVLDVLIIGSMFGIEKLQQRYQETSFSSEARDEIDLDALQLVSQHWSTGTGAGSFYSVFPQAQTQLYHGFYDHAHNDYLQFAIEFGVPVTLCLWLWLATLAWRCFQTMRNHELKLARGVCFAGLMALLFMGLHCTVDFMLQAPANVLMFLSILVMATQSKTLAANHARGS